MRMRGRRRLGFSITIVMIPVFLSVLAHANIYRYKDEKGIWHFTNVKDDARYRLYIRTPQERPAVFIKKFENIIDQAASRFHVAPSLIKAIIKAESDFDHKAVSAKGAKGLMQLMPDTAGAMEVQDPYDPEENIFGGTRYFSRMLARFKNLKKALAAYNAGPEAVQKCGGVPPIPQTKAFVERVLKYYHHFENKRP